MKKLYKIFLEGNLIGETKLEKADASMGVVYGKITPFSEIISYSKLKAYCEKNEIGLIHNFPEEKLIGTSKIAEIKVLNENGIEIEGLGTHIEGMDKEGFEIHILGIAYPFYENEFPHHVKAYES